MLCCCGLTDAAFLVGNSNDLTFRHNKISFPHGRMITKSIPSFQSSHASQIKEPVFCRQISFSLRFERYKNKGTVFRPDDRFTLNRHRTRRDSSFYSASFDVDVSYISSIPTSYSLPFTASYTHFALVTPSTSY